MADPTVPTRPPVDAATYWAAPVQTGLSEWYWKDPEPSVSGMLGSDRIRAYDRAVGGIIRPFQNDRLRPASYELTLGPRWLIQGEERLLSDAEPVLEIPPNTIAFASTLEVLYMPHWLAARFDLSVDYLYQGLLVGAGPQVDPGFKGALSCPLHNTSTQKVVLRFRDPFLKIDFMKTTGLRNVNLNDVTDETCLYQSTLEGYDRERIVLFKRHGQFREPIFFQPAARRVLSSLRELDETYRRLRRVNFAALLAYLALIVTLIAMFAGISTFLFNSTNSRVESAERAANQVRTLHDRVEASRADQARMRASLARLQRELRRVAAGHP